MASRAIDLLIAYRVLKMLVTPFNKQPAFKNGIIDDKGKVLRKFKTLTTSSDKQSYTMLNRFVFNLKRILKRVGLGSRLGSFAVSLALLIKENKQYSEHQTLIESVIVSYLKDTNQYDSLLNEQGEVISIEDKPYTSCFGVDVYEVDDKLISENEYAQTL